MPTLINLAAVRITLGTLNFYIPANQVGRCSLVTGGGAGYPAF